MFSMHSIPAKPQTALSEGSFYLQFPVIFLIVYHMNGEFKASFRTSFILNPFPFLHIDFEFRTLQDHYIPVSRDV